MGKRFAVLGIGPDTPVLSAAPELLLARSGPLFRLEAKAAAGLDPDVVHDLRVSSRRLREALRLFSPLYPRGEHRVWYGRARTITRTFGPVRDADVFGVLAGELVPDLDEGGRRALAFVSGYRTGHRVHDLAVAGELAASFDPDEERASFKRFARKPKHSDEGRMPLSAFARPRIERRAAAIVDEQPGALIPSRVAGQHRLRIGYKRLRYALETFAVCYGDAFGDLHETVTAFQDTLGDLHDTYVLMDLLADPGLRDPAAAAGTGPEDVESLMRVLETRAARLFGRFVELVAVHPAERLRAAVLEPLGGPVDEPAA